MFFKTLTLRIILENRMPPMKDLQSLGFKFWGVCSEFSFIVESTTEKSVGMRPPVEILLGC
jgi:hypothetical protein